MKQRKRKISQSSFREWIKDKNNWLPYFWVILIILAIVWLTINWISFIVIFLIPFIIIASLVHQSKKEQIEEPVEDNSQQIINSTKQVTLTDQNFTVVDADNLQVKMSLNNFPLQGQDGVITITLKEKTLKRLLSKKEKLNQEVYHNVLHELKNSLTVLKGNLGLMNKDKRQTQKVKLMRAAVAQMEKLTDDNLLLGRLNYHSARKEFCLISLKPLVQEVIDCLVPLARKNKIHLITHFDNLRIYGNQFSLKILFHNLIENAIKYSERGDKVMIYLFKQGHKIIFKVTDQGKGIAPRDLATIFVPFKRGQDVKTVVEGNGLGLTIAKNIAEVHRGKVNVNSQLGKGSVFWVELPA